MTDRLRISARRIRAKSARAPTQSKTLSARDPKQHSKDISARHRALYDRIAALSDVMAAAPAVVFISGEWSATYGGQALCQAIPLRVWVGIESFGRAPVAGTALYTPGKLHFYCASKDRFDPPTDCPGPDESAAFHAHFESVVRELGIGKFFRYHVISEFPRGSGANWSGAFASALTVSLSLFAGVLKADEVQQWRHISPSQLIADTKFAECNSRAWRIEQALQGGMASGYGNLVCLASDGMPVIYRNKASRPEHTSASANAAFWRTLSYDFERLERRAPLALVLMDSGATKSTAAANNTCDQWSIEAQGLLGDRSTDVFHGLRVQVQDSADIVVGAYARLAQRQESATAREREVFLSSIQWLHRALLGFGCGWPPGELLRMAFESQAPGQLVAKLTGSGGGGSLVGFSFLSAVANDEFRRQIESAYRTYDSWVARSPELTGESRGSIDRSAAPLWCSTRDGFFKEWPPMIAMGADAESRMVYKMPPPTTVRYVVVDFGPKRSTPEFAQTVVEPLAEWRGHKSEFLHSSAGQPPVVLIDRIDNLVRCGKRRAEARHVASLLHEAIVPTDEKCRAGTAADWTVACEREFSQSMADKIVREAREDLRLEQTGIRWSVTKAARASFALRVRVLKEVRFVIASMEEP